jgi:hypothetical protein
MFLRILANVKSLVTDFGKSITVLPGEIHFWFAIFRNAGSNGLPFSVKYIL